MAFRFRLLIFLILVGVISSAPFSTASTTSNPASRAINDPKRDCIYGIYDAKCWDVLNLTNWLTDWYQTTPICSTGDTRRCRAPNEAWTTTLLRIALNITGGPDCTNLNACEGNPPGSNEIVGFNDTEAARYRYVVYNIYSINFFFSTWYQAMYNAAFEAGDLIYDIVQTIDPLSKKSNVLLNDLLGALAAGLAFLAIPQVAAVGGAAAAIAPIFLKAIQQAPGVAKIIWPFGSVERETIEITELYQQLGTVVGALGPRISDALAAVQGVNQTDISAFLAFADEGAFSVPRADFPNIVDDTSGLLVAFTTFLVSEALILDGWHVDIAPGVDPLMMSQANATCPVWFCNCGKFEDLGCYSYDTYSQCTDKYWWYGELTHSAYTLSKDPYFGYFESATKNEKDPTQIMQTIFSNRWSTGQLLLENAGLCVLEASFASSLGPAILGSATWSDFVIDSLASNDTTMCYDDIQNGYLASTGYYRLGPTLSIARPTETLYNISRSGIDFNCTSQLNLTVLTDWASVWYLHRKLT